jgi:predicted P-loop ATPase
VAENIVILHHASALLTKTWSLGERGKPIQQDYGFAKTFQAQVVELVNFTDLCELLDVLATEPHRCAIRGAPIAGRNLDSVLRRKKARADEAAFFQEQPRCWMMLDVDIKSSDIPLDYSTPEGCQAAINTAIGQLPFEVRLAGCWWQLSSSAGFKGGIRAHLWFWLDRPLGEIELTRWGEFANETAGKLIVDTAVFRTVQVHYTANPVFDGVIDPVAQRTGYIAGPPATLPRLAARMGAWRKKLEPLADPTNKEIHKHIRDACASYFCAGGPDAPANVLELALRQAVARAEDLQERKGDYPEEKLQAEIASGRDFARNRAAAGENLLLGTDGTPKSTIGNAYAIMQSSEIWRELVGYNKRENRVDLLREPPWGGPPRAWSDADSVEAATWFVREQRMAADDAIVYRAVMALARLHTFDPVADYLENLVWDGIPRLDTWLIDWCNSKDTVYNRRVGRLWPVSAVARALTTNPEGVQVDTVMVLQGATGVKKTSLLRMLGGRWYAAVIDDKDLVQKIHGPWIVEFPELGPFTAGDVNKIKGFVDQKKDRYRTPYARVPEDKTRGSVIVATTNEQKWQQDATSARRFWPVDVERIDLAKVDRDQLWAEAVQAYKSGEEWWVDAADPDFATAQNDQYASDPWEDLIGYAVDEGKAAWDPDGKMVSIPGNCRKVSTASIFIVVFGDRHMRKQEQNRVAKCMRRLGWVAKDRGWERLVQP